MRRKHPHFQRHNKIVMKALKQMGLMVGPHYIEQAIETVIAMEAAPFKYDLDILEELIPVAIENTRGQQYATSFTFLFRTAKTRPDQHPIGKALAEKREKAQQEQRQVNQQTEAVRFRHLKDLSDSERATELAAMKSQLGLKDRKKRRGRRERSEEGTELREATPEEYAVADAKRRQIQEQLAAMSNK